MNARCKLLAAALAAAMVIGGGQVAQSTERCFTDDFRNNTNPVDCPRDPICWRVPDFPGWCCTEISPSLEGLDFRNTTGADAGILTEDAFAGDISVELRGSFNGNTKIPEEETSLAVMPRFDLTTVVHRTRSIS
jgi:hypothetical protein